MAAAASSSPASPAMATPNYVTHFNVGGVPIDVARDTLERHPKSLLRALAAECPPGSEVFVDRDAVGLRTLVDYLRCGTRVLYDAAPTPAHAEFLAREAEFYGFPDMASKCLALYEFKPRCEVAWRPHVVEAYATVFAKCIVDSSLQIPFTYERNSHIVARCIACEESYEPRASNVFVFSLHEWSALESHMRSIHGVVERLIGTSCLLVKWSNGACTHLPKSALRVVVDS